jgi:FkbM family methyltransferase
MGISGIAALASSRVISPILARLNARAGWWPLGVFKVRSNASIATVAIRGKTVTLQFPEGEFQEQQREISHLYIDDPYGLKVLPSEIHTVLDIGGNIGFFSMLARHYFPLAIIHCYEPNPALFPILTANTRDLGIVVHPAGVAATNGTAKMNFNGTTLVGSLSLHPSESGEITVTAMRDAMDRLGGTVDLVKMDCEGAEWDILEDAESLRRIKHLAMEYHLQHGSDKTVDGLVKHLKAHGLFIDSLRESSLSVVGQLTASRR